jgi:hypothetical protein
MTYVLEISFLPSGYLLGNTDPAPPTLSPEPKRAMLAVWGRGDIKCVMVQSFHLSAYGLQLALDTSEVFFAGPVRFGPDVAHGFPDMSAFGQLYSRICRNERGAYRT